MKCLIIFGPPAVGKMTVGKAISEKTGYKLLHNHMSIDLLLNFFEHGSPEFWKLDELIRFSIMREIAKSDFPGFIFTYMWAFERKGEETEDMAYINRIEQIFAEEGADTVFLELECSLEERLKRNTSAYRLEQKPSKRDTEFTEKMMIKDDEEYRLNSIDGDLGGRKHLKINNENLSPEAVAQIAIEKLELTSL
jgi:hypothetical protein